jgi:hypothetical protein
MFGSVTLHYSPRMRTFPLGSLERIGSVTDETASNRELPPIVNNPGLPRTAFKMATGTGKAVVMVMLIAWPSSPRMTGVAPYYPAASWNFARKEWAG